MEDKIAAVKATKDSTDLDAIKKATEELSTVTQKIGQELYKQQDQNQATSEQVNKEESKEEAKAEESKTEEKAAQ